MRLNICSKVVPKETWNLEAVLTELKKKLEDRERCDYSAVLDSSDSSVEEDQNLPPMKKSGGKPPPPTTTSALMAGSEENKNQHVSNFKIIRPFIVPL